MQVGRREAHLLLWLVLVQASSARGADAECIRRQLRVEPGATCLSAARLAAEVEQLIADTPLADDFVFFVEGNASDRQRVYLRVVRQEGIVAERAFAPGPERCSHLHAAVALAIALAIKAQPAQVSHVARPWSLSAAGLWSHRLLPEFAPGFELSLRRTAGVHVLFRVAASAALASGAQLPTLPGTFDAALLAANADGCGRIELVSSLKAGICLGVLGGLLHVSGEDVAVSTSSSIPWIALSSALDFEFELAPRWSVLFVFSTSFLLHRIELGFETASGAPGDSRELSRFGIALAIGLAYHL